MKRVCVFVDGENFRRTIGKLFIDGFDPEEYLPREAKWAEFFDWLTETICGEKTPRLRAYWYVIQQVDFYPYKIPSLSREPGTLETVLRKYQPYREVLAGLEDEAKTRKLKLYAKRLNEKRTRFEKRFQGWRVIQEGIAKAHRAVEFRRAGAIRYNLFEKQLGHEKAVDVKLAIDMIELKHIYDVAIIVSGDQDFVPAVQAIKDAGKEVYNVAFKTQNGKLLPGGARRLNERTDDSFEVPYKDLKKFLKL